MARKILFRYRYLLAIVSGTNRNRGYDEKTIENRGGKIRRERKRGQSARNDPSNRINPRPINPFIGPANPTMGQIEGGNCKTGPARFVMVTSKSLSSETNDRDKVDETKIVYFRPNSFFKAFLFFFSYFHIIKHLIIIFI